MSVKLESILYKIITDMNWHKLYEAMYLNMPKLVTRAALPSFIIFNTHVISGFFDVKGLATDDSASDSDIPV